MLHSKRDDITAVRLARRSVLVPSRLASTELEKSPPAAVE